MRSQPTFQQQMPASPRRRDRLEICPPEWKARFDFALRTGFGCAESRLSRWPGPRRLDGSRPNADACTFVGSLDTGVALASLRVMAQCSSDTGALCYGAGTGGARCASDGDGQCGSGSAGQVTAGPVCRHSTRRPKILLHAAACSSHAKILLRARPGAHGVCMLPHGGVQMRHSMQRGACA
jgi:hypothetical protein